MANMIDSARSWRRSKYSASRNTRPTVSSKSIDLPIPSPQHLSVSGEPQIGLSTTVPPSSTMQDTTAKSLGSGTQADKPQTAGATPMQCRRSNTIAGSGASLKPQATFSVAPSQTMPAPPALSSSLPRNTEPPRENRFSLTAYMREKFLSRASSGSADKKDIAQTKPFKPSKSDKPPNEVNQSKAESGQIAVGQSTFSVIRTPKSFNKTPGIAARVQPERDLGAVAGKQNSLEAKSASAVADVPRMSAVTDDKTVGPLSQPANKHPSDVLLKTNDTQELTNLSTHSAQEKMIPLAADDKRNALDLSKTKIRRPWSSVDQSRKDAPVTTAGNLSQSQQQKHLDEGHGALAAAPLYTQQRSQSQDSSSLKVRTFSPTKDAQKSYKNKPSATLSVMPTEVTVSDTDLGSSAPINKPLSIHAHDSLGNSAPVILSGGIKAAAYPAHAPVIKVDSVDTAVSSGSQTLATQASKSPSILRRDYSNDSIRSTSSAGSGAVSAESNTHRILEKAKYLRSLAKKRMDELEQLQYRIRESSTDTSTASVTSPKLKKQGDDSLPSSPTKRPSDVNLDGEFDDGTFKPPAPASTESRDRQSPTVSDRSSSFKRPISIAAKFQDRGKQPMNQELGVCYASRNRPQTSRMSGSDNEGLAASSSISLKRMGGGSVDDVLSTGGKADQTDAAIVTGQDGGGMFCIEDSQPLNASIVIDNDVPPEIVQQTPTQIHSFDSSALDTETRDKAADIPYEETPIERIQRYREERRRQLAEKYGLNLDEISAKMHKKSLNKRQEAFDTSDNKDPLSKRFERFAARPGGFCRIVSDPTTDMIEDQTPTLPPIRQTKPLVKDLLADAVEAERNHCLKNDDYNNNGSHFDNVQRQDLAPRVTAFDRDDGRVYSSDEHRQLTAEGNNMASIRRENLQKQTSADSIDVVTKLGQHPTSYATRRRNLMNTRKLKSFHEDMLHPSDVSGARTSHSTDLKPECMSAKFLSGAKPDSETEWFAKHAFVTTSSSSEFDPSQILTPTGEFTASKPQALAAKFPTESSTSQTQNSRDLSEAKTQAQPIKLRRKKPARHDVRRYTDGYKYDAEREQWTGVGIDTAYAVDDSENTSPRKPVPRMGTRHIVHQTSLTKTPLDPAPVTESASCSAKEKVSDWLQYQQQMPYEEKPADTPTNDIEQERNERLSRLEFLENTLRTSDGSADSVTCTRLNGFDSQPQPYVSSPPIISPPPIDENIDLTEPPLEETSIPVVTPPPEFRSSPASSKNIDRRVSHPKTSAGGVFTFPAGEDHDVRRVRLYSENRENESQKALVGNASIIQHSLPGESAPFLSDKTDDAQTHTPLEVNEISTTPISASENILKHEASPSHQRYYNQDTEQLGSSVLTYAVDSSQQQQQPTKSMDQELAAILKARRDAETISAATGLPPVSPTIRPNLERKDEHIVSASKPLDLALPVEIQDEPVIEIHDRTPGLENGLITDISPGINKVSFDETVPTKAHSASASSHKSTDSSPDQPRSILKRKSSNTPVLHSILKSYSGDSGSDADEPTPLGILKRPGSASSHEGDSSAPMHSILKNHSPEDTPVMDSRRNSDLIGPRPILKQKSRDSRSKSIDFIDPLPRSILKHDKPGSGESMDGAETPPKSILKRSSDDSGVFKSKPILKSHPNRLRRNSESDLMERPRRNVDEYNLLLDQFYSTTPLSTHGSRSREQHVTIVEQPVAVVEVDIVSSVLRQHNIDLSPAGTDSEPKSILKHRSRSVSPPRGILRNKANHNEENNEISRRSWTFSEAESPSRPKSTFASSAMHQVQPISPLSITRPTPLIQTANTEIAEASISVQQEPAVSVINIAPIVKDIEPASESRTQQIAEVPVSEPINVNEIDTEQASAAKQQPARLFGGSVESAVLRKKLPKECDDQLASLLAARRSLHAETSSDSDEVDANRGLPMTESEEQGPPLSIAERIQRLETSATEIHTDKKPDSTQESSTDDVAETEEAKVLLAEAESVASRRKRFQAALRSNHRRQTQPVTCEELEQAVRNMTPSPSKSPTANDDRPKQPIACPNANNIARLTNQSFVSTSVKPVVASHASLTLRTPVVSNHIQRITFQLQANSNSEWPKRWSCGIRRSQSSGPTDRARPKIDIKSRWRDASSGDTCTSDSSELKRDKTVSAVNDTGNKTRKLFIPVRTGHTQKIAQQFTNGDALPAEFVVAKLATSETPAADSVRKPRESISLIKHGHAQRIAEQLQNSLNKPESADADPSIHPNRDSLLHIDSGNLSKLTKAFEEGGVAEPRDTEIVSRASANLLESGHALNMAKQFDNDSPFEIENDSVFASRNSLAELQSSGYAHKLKELWSSPQVFTTGGLNDSDAANETDEADSSGPTKKFGANWYPEKDTSENDRALSPNRQSLLDIETGSTQRIAEQISTSQTESLAVAKHRPSLSTQPGNTLLMAKQLTSSLPAKADTPPRRESLPQSSTGLIARMTETLTTENSAEPPETAPVVKVGKLDVGNVAVQLSGAADTTGKNTPHATKVGKLDTAKLLALDQEISGRPIKHSLPKQRTGKIAEKATELESHLNLVYHREKLSNLHADSHHKIEHTIKSRVHELESVINIVPTEQKLSPRHRLSRSSIDLEEAKPTSLLLYQNRLVQYDDDKEFEHVFSTNRSMLNGSPVDLDLLGVEDPDLDDLAAQYLNEDASFKPERAPVVKRKLKKSKQLRFKRHQSLPMSAEESDNEDTCPPIPIFDSKQSHTVYTSPHKLTNTIGLSTAPVSENSPALITNTDPHDTMPTDSRYSPNQQYTASESPSFKTSTPVKQTDESRMISDPEKDTLAQGDDEDEKEDELSRLSLAEKLNLFNQQGRIISTAPPLPKERRKTQPVTIEEVRDASSKYNSSRSQPTDDSSINSSQNIVYNSVTVDQSNSSVMSAEPGRHKIKNEAIARRFNRVNASRNPTAALNNSESSADSTDSTLSAQQRRERHLTQPITVDEEEEAESLTGNRSVADRLRALQKAGRDNWKKRIVPENVVLRKKTSKTGERPVSINDRLTELTGSQHDWKKRVAETDAKLFTVESKIQTAGQQSSSSNQFAARNVRSKKCLAKPQRPHSVLVLPSDCPALRSMGPDTNLVTQEDQQQYATVPIESTAKAVLVPRFDEALNSFFDTDISSAHNENSVIDLPDIDSLSTNESSLLRPTKDVIQRPKRKARTNPLKAMQQQAEQSYVETGSQAQSSMSAINAALARRKPRQLQSGSGAAAQAKLAALMAREDMSAVSLKSAEESTAGIEELQPFTSLMLIQIKGRRQVQTRLVEPCAASVNSGDCYVLVTPNTVYNWIGEFSNVIEKSKSSSMAAYIVQKKDMGCRGSPKLYTIDESRPNINANRAFWSLLGAKEPATAQAAGSSKDDELYETLLSETVMTYRVEGTALQVLDAGWGLQPKCELLQPTEVLIFDFGSELYAWMGSLASPESRRIAQAFAKLLWEQGYDYLTPGCEINPIYPKLPVDASKMKASLRPQWCLLAKVNQKMETILFKEKFTDWPDASRLIRTKSEGATSPTDPSAPLVELTFCNGAQMAKYEPPPVSLVLERSNLGRGRYWREYVDGLKWEYRIDTLRFTMWRVSEYSAEELPEDEIRCQFFDSDTMVIRWHYRVMATGFKSLKGESSKSKTDTGRDRCAYLFWHGQNSSVTDKGASALLTVELNEEKGPQIKVDQFKEPPAFLQLFNGHLVYHVTVSRDVMSPSYNKEDTWSLYRCAGDFLEESVLIQTACHLQNLRSKCSYLLLNRKTGVLFLWHGTCSPPHVRQIAAQRVSYLLNKCPAEFCLSYGVQLAYQGEIEENNEPLLFCSALGQGEVYESLAKDSIPNPVPIRLFMFSSVQSGLFEYQPILDACRSELPSPFPFSQSDLYSATQPALFLIDNDTELFLWQGWWPSDDIATSSAVSRFCAERRCALLSCQSYANAKKPANPPPITVMFAGLETLHFTNLFPIWEYRADVAFLQKKLGRVKSRTAAEELSLLTVTDVMYSLDQLKQTPLPDGVDPLHLEKYLSDTDFQSALGMTKDEFSHLPVWKQHNCKREAGLF